MSLHDNLIEENYSRKKDVQYRRSLGQFFTPFKIARFMSQWILDNPKSTLRILDPAAGFGVFERALEYENEAIGKNLVYDLWEIDKSIARELSDIIQQAGIKAEIFSQDFLEGTWERKFDGIIANPPYYKHHYIKNKSEIYQKICLKTAFRFSVQTNIYCWFLIKSLRLLDEGGRLAFIVPSEFLNANYGEQVKSYLRQSDFMLHLINIHFKQNVFENALTTSIIILGDKMQRRCDAINFYNVSDVEKLNDLRDFLSTHPHNPVDITGLNPKSKWRNYFNGHKNGERSKSLIRFSEFGRFSRGIATGANHYFTLNNQEIKKYRIPDECLIPCVTKTIHVKDVLFTDKDFQELLTENKKVYLFDGQGSNAEECQRYLRWGESIGIHNRYLTRNRNPWYSLEKRKVSRIWAAVFGRKGLKFIWNETNCLTLTCFHVFYPTTLGERYLDILFLYLNTSLAKKLIDEEKREYGNGLGKFEPNDINKAYALDFSSLDEAHIEDLREMQRQFVNSDRQQREGILQKAEKYFREAFESTPVESTHQSSLFHH